MSILNKSKQLYDKLALRLSGKRVVYHHVPKCGGTSVARAFRLRYLLSQTSLDAGASVLALHHLYPDDSPEAHFRRLRAFRESILLYHLNSDIHWISGHIRFSETAYENFSGNYRFITVLREPVSRYISNYYYNHGKSGYAGTRLPLDEYLETFEGRMHGCLYADYFSGLPADTDFHSKEAVAMAKTNLEKFDLVGFTHEMEEFATRAQQLLGVRVRVGHENIASKDRKSSAAALPDSTLEKIRAICATDAEIYEFACGIASKRK